MLGGSSQKQGIPIEVISRSNDIIRRSVIFHSVWNIVTIQQHFLFCKRQGVQECLYRFFP